MKFYTAGVMATAFLLWSCNINSRTEANNHEAETHEHEHGEEISQQLIQYTEAFELFAEADPFVVGQEAAVLAHLTHLGNFKPLNGATVEVKLQIGGQSVQTKGEPKVAGIYKFSLKPTKAGKGKLILTINSGNDKVEVPVTVFANEHDAHAGLPESPNAKANSVSFTKEQSWYVDFATQPVPESTMGQVIRTTAKVEALPAKTRTLTAQIGGVVSFVSNNLVEGAPVTKGQRMFSIIGSGAGEANAALIYQQAKADFELAEAEYQRMKPLAAKEIVSQKVFMETTNNYEKAKAKYDNLKRNFNENGQSIAAAQGGVVEKILVKNGQQVEPGQPLAVVAAYDQVQLVAAVSGKYRLALADINSLAYRNNGGEWLELDGKIVSVGERVNSNDFRLPVYFEAAGASDLLPGSLVEVNLCCTSAVPVVAVPNTALLEQQGNFFVFVQQTPELFEKRQVTPGATNGVETVIAKGLSVGERIVSKGAVLVKLAAVSSSLDPHAGHVH